MGYAVGDRVEYTFYGKTNMGWLIAMHPLKEHTHRKQHRCFEGLTPLWEIKETRVSHLCLIDEKQITKRISSNFEGYNKQLQKEKKDDKQKVALMG